MERSVCDWCESEERSVRQVGLSKRSGAKFGRGTNRSEYSGERIKENGDRVENSNSSERGKNGNGSGVPSPRPAGRRYKLLKDVLC